jgi:hypothetical protein
MISAKHFSLSILFLPLLFFSSCKTHRVASGMAAVKKADTTAMNEDAAKFIQQSNANRIPYDWFATRIKVEYSDPMQSQDFTAVVRMKRDSVMWVSLQGPFGIEGARILITRDTIKLVNKLSGEYLCQPIGYLSTLLPMQIDMGHLQDFILGYYLQFSGVGTTYRGMEDSLHLIQAESAQMRYRASLYPQNYTLAKSLLTDKMAGEEMNTTFGGYTAEQGKPFSEDRTIDIKQGSKTINLHLSYTKVRINEPLVFPFEVDPSLKRVDRIRF